MVSDFTIHETIKMVPVMVLNVLILYFLTIFYLKFYKMTRKEDRLVIKTALKKRSLLIIGFCLFLSVSGYFFDNSLKCILPLLGIIAGIDIIILKIPTECLILLAIMCIKIYAQSMLFMRMINSAVVFMLWYAFRKKLKIGLFDILLISILSLNFRSISSSLLFSSAILILWGCTGLVLQKAFKIHPKTKIPLAPLISAAFIALMIP